MQQEVGDSKSSQELAECNQKLRQLPIAQAANIRDGLSMD
jgi:hypothetical protein